MSDRNIFFKHLGLPSSNPLAIEIDRARGIYFYDKQGKKYIDLVSGVAVSNTGHLHPEVVQAVSGQLEKYMHLMVYGEIIQSPQTQLAEFLVNRLPDTLNSVYLVNSGSEAIEGAIKLAKRYTGRSQIVAFNNAYHGGTHGALSILGNEDLKYAFRPLLPEVYHLRYNNIDDLEMITQETACVVLETVQAEAGIILPVPSFLAELQKKCKQTGTLLIIDDIQMGIGRTGKLFSFEHFELIPDVLVLAKALGGGMPLGAFIAEKEIMHSLTNRPALGHITTFGGHPVSCAAALAALKVITRGDLIPEAEKKGQAIYEALKDHPQIKEIRQIGLMLGLDLESPDLATKLVNIFTDNGLITDRFLFRPQAFRIAPPLTITWQEIEDITLLVKKLLDKL